MVIAARPPPRAEPSDEVDQGKGSKEEQSQVDRQAQGHRRDSDEQRDQYVKKHWTSSVGRGDHWRRRERQGGNVTIADAVAYLRSERDRTVAGDPNDSGRDRDISAVDGA
jgi:hypothetical protein